MCVMCILCTFDNAIVIVTNLHIKITVQGSYWEVCPMLMVTLFYWVILEKERMVWTVQLHRLTVVDKMLMECQSLLNAEESFTILMEPPWSQQGVVLVVMDSSEEEVISSFLSSECPQLLLLHPLDDIAVTFLIEMESVRTCSLILVS